MIPAVFILRFTGILQYEKKPVSPGEESVVPPGSMTPSMSRVPLSATEEPMAGADEDPATQDVKM